MAEEFERADYRVADDRAPQMPDVHLLGEVWAGIVHDDGLRAVGSGGAEVLVGHGVAETLGEELTVEGNVHEPGSGDLHRVGDVVKLGRGEDLFRQFARVGLLLLCGGHYPVRLVVAELRAGGR